MPDLLTHFHPSAIQNFETFQTHATNPDAIAGMGRNGSVEQTGTKNFWNTFFRTGTAKAHNNEVRTQLLESLGSALDIGGTRTTSKGTICFSPKFIGELQKLLGDSFKMEDFGFCKDGAVTSGKPLTQRRISAIMAKVQEVGQARMAASNAVVGDSQTLQQVRTFADYVQLNGSQTADSYSRGIQNAALMLEGLKQPSSKGILQSTGKPYEWTIQFGSTKATVKNAGDLAKFFQENLNLYGVEPDFDLHTTDLRIINANLRTKLDNHVEKSIQAFNLDSQQFFAGINEMTKLGSLSLSSSNDFCDEIIRAHEPQE